MWRFIPVFLVCHNVLGSTLPRVEPIVETSLGSIRGLVSEDGQYSKFLGIPYAVVDEEHPFSESTPSTAFNGTFNAFDDTVRCPQIEGRTPTGQLQCLNLNIYVPNNASSQNPKAVMVYFHGGGFFVGKTDLDPHNLMSYDIIYISFTYRVGIYGFMCTDSPKAPGNVGLKDQLTALRWINEHIESFGGDKNKITVFGASAGGMSIHLHILSSYENLFDQAIIQSGPATSPFTIVQRNNDVPLRIAEILGLVTDDVEEAIDLIAKTDVHQAIGAGAQLPSISPAYPIESLTKPCVERQFEGIRRIVEVNANDAIPEKVKTMKVLIGFCSQEMIFFHNRMTAETYANYSFKDLLQFGYNVTNFDESANDLRRFYLGDNATSFDTRNEITTFASDFVFNHPTVRAVNAMLDVGPEALYHYLFSYNREGHNGTLEGTTHSDELTYLFSTGEATEADQLTVDRVSTLWTNFAKYGDPTPEITELLPVKWEPVPENSKPYLNIAKELTVLKRPFHDRMAFWDLFFELNKEHTIWYHDD